MALDANRCLYRHLQNLYVRMVFAMDLMLNRSIQLWPPFGPDIHVSLARFKETKAERKVAEGVAGTSADGDYPPTPNEVCDRYLPHAFLTGF